MLLVLILILSFTKILALTGSQASSSCHCNLTPSFCDFDCCCDTDCSSVINPPLRLSLHSALTLTVTPIALTLLFSQE